MKISSEKHLGNGSGSDREVDVTTELLRAHEHPSVPSLDELAITVEMQEMEAKGLAMGGYAHLRSMMQRLDEKIASEYPEIPNFFGEHHFIERTENRLRISYSQKPNCRSTITVIEYAVSSKGRKSSRKNRTLTIQQHSGIREDFLFADTMYEFPHNQILNFRVFGEPMYTSLCNLIHTPRKNDRSLKEIRNTWRLHTAMREEYEREKKEKYKEGSSFSGLKGVAVMGASFGGVIGAVIQKAGLIGYEFISQTSDSIPAVLQNPWFGFCFPGAVGAAITTMYYRDFEAKEYARKKTNIMESLISTLNVAFDERKTIKNREVAKIDETTYQDDLITTLDVIARAKSVLPGAFTAIEQCGNEERNETNEAERRRQEAETSRYRETLKRKDADITRAIDDYRNAQ